MKYQHKWKDKKSTYKAVSQLKQEQKSSRSEKCFYGCPQPARQWKAASSQRSPDSWRRWTCLPRPAVSEKNLQITEYSFGALYSVLYFEGGSEKNLWNNKTRNINWTVRIKKPEEAKDILASLRTIKKPNQTKNIIQEIKHSLHLIWGISSGSI